MRCLYEVLEVTQEADEAEIKKNYRKLALKWHPDKNAHQADEANERFQEIQNAWEVLSDPQERAWYTAHRAQILRSGSHQAGGPGDGVGAECPDEPVDLAHFQSRACFAGFTNAPGGFYRVYDALFDKLAQQEHAAFKRQRALAKDLKPPREAPRFGTAGASEQDVKQCYAFWCNFQTVKDFAWLDQYNPATAPGRRIRRLMEAENDKRRKAGKLQYVAQVRGLAEWVRDNDERVQAFKAGAEERRLQRQVDEAARRDAEKQAKRAAAAAYKDADWIRESEEAQLAAMDAEAAPEAEAEIHECVACGKAYKTEKALRNHENSKKHKEQLKVFKRMMEQEDLLAL